VRLVALRDLACLAALVPLASALHLLYPVPPGISKDGIAYLVFSNGLLSDFSLYLPAWIHVDSGMILPPLFPFLVGLATRLTSSFDVEAISVAKRVCAASLSMASIPLYFLLKSGSSRAVSLFAVGLVHLNLAYFRIGSSGLTEATFILVVATALLALARAAESFNARLGILVGLLCAFAFLTRQIGLIAFPFCLSWLALSGWVREIALRKSARMLAMVSLGFFAVFGSYAGVLYAQTGQHPFQQKFRWNRYTVSTEDPAVHEEIERIGALPVEEYAQIYAKRRMMFQLTPDGAEMYDYLVHQDGDQTVDRVEVENWTELVFGAAGNLKGNLAHLRGRIGTSYYWAFLVATLAVFVPPSRRWSAWRQRVVMAFAWMYLISVSLLGDLVARYVVVLIPFVLLATTIELFRVARGFPGGSRVATLFAIGFVGAGASLMPRIDVTDIPEGVERRNWPQSAFRDSLEPGTRVFSMAPLDAYLIGGTWMILPNDSLRRVVEYGRRTGSLWIFVARNQLRRSDEKHYAEKGGWYRNRNLEAHYPYLVQRCRFTETRKYRFYLYRIRPEGVPPFSDPNSCAPIRFLRTRGARRRGGWTAPDRALGAPASGAAGRTDPAGRPRARFRAAGSSPAATRTRH
jgi:hypothetical protein